MKTTIDKPTSLYEKREKIQNRWVKGPFQTLRVITIWLTLGWFFCAPWITYDSRQAILFDLEERKFHIFGMTFWPQDFFLLLLLLIAAAITLMVITNLAGRIWCGYTCPQTVWTRFYMWIEYLTEGDRNKRLKRDQNPYELVTIFRRTLKHILWLALAFFTAITFVGYFTPVKVLIPGFFHFSLGGWEYFWLGFFTLATYVNAGWMREQVCLHMCPYARFQSVMLDQNSLIISYNALRGEPRGARKHNAQETALGDCIDCQLCVQVCPTGIDIREGLQVGCIGCAACIDACNGVMKKMNYPKNLISYASEQAIQNKKVKIIRPRLVASIALWLIVVTVFMSLLLTRVPLQFSVAHDHRYLSRMTATGDIENTYLLTVTNMTNKTQHYVISVEGVQNAKTVGATDIVLDAESSTIIPITVRTQSKNTNQFSTKIHFKIQSTTQPVLQLSKDSNFFFKA